MRSLPNVIAALADDLERPDGAGGLVIDDFHVTGVAGAQALGLLLEYRPPSLQLVVASRVDPELRLHWMPANGGWSSRGTGTCPFPPRTREALLSGFGVRLSESDLAVLHRPVEKSRLPSQGHRRCPIMPGLSAKTLG